MNIDGRQIFAKVPGLEKYARLTRPGQIHFRVSESLVGRRHEWNDAPADFRGEAKSWGNLFEYVEIPSVL